MTGPDLFGREADLAWLDTCWQDGVHVASIVAWGGVGKSALVNAWLAKLRDAGWRGAERVFGWSFYSQGASDKRVTSADEFVSAALGWFGDADPTAGSPWDKGERLARLIRKQRTLLLLDGLEPLQGGPGAQEGRIKDLALQALVRELGAENRGLCVITTRTGVADLRGGDKVRDKRLEHLSVEAGAELLRQRGVKGLEEELREAAKEYGGHCMALTLLGSYLEEACDGDIRRRKEIGPLAEDERFGGHARRVMAAYERWFQGGPEIAVLRMLGLFDRPVDEKEIAALRQAPTIEGLTDLLAGLSEQKWNKAIAKLRRVGLLAVEQDKRLDAHPLVREHFGEQVRQESPEAWREGHRRLYEHLQKTVKLLPDTIEEMGPLYAAVVHGCLASKHQEALQEVFRNRIYRGQDKFNWSKLGAFGSEAAVLAAFFDPPWERLAPGLSEPNQAFVLNAAGFALQALGRLPEAAGLLRRALERYIAQEDWENAANAADNLSELLQARGELTEALAVARQSVALADERDDTFERVSNKAMLAAVLHATGRRRDAAAQMEDAERRLKKIAPEVPLLYSFSGFRYCDLLLDQGRVAEVRERAAQTLEWANTLGDLLGIALDHLSLGRVHLLAAQRDGAAALTPAAAHLQQTVEGLRRAGHQDCLHLGLLARADLHTFTRDFPAARRDLDEALTLATRCGFRLHEADAHLGYARLHLTEGDRAATRAHLAKARAIIQATGYHRRDEELARLDALLA